MNLKYFSSLPWQRMDTNGESFGRRICRNLQLVKHLYVEPFLLLYMFGYALSSMAVSQLVQDKLCRVDYDQTPQFCISINSQDFDHGGEGIKSQIITKSNYITLYRTLLSTLPCIIWVIFLGPWSDTYVNGRKYILIAGGLAAALESLILVVNASVFYASKYCSFFCWQLFIVLCFVICNLGAYFVLFAFIPSALSGGIIATMMAVNAYVSANSDAETRATRFSVMEVCFWIAQPIGSFIGGQILGNGDENTRYQLYNYIPVFVVSSCAQIAGIIWVVLVINENNNNKSLDSSDCSSQISYDEAQSQQSVARPTTVPGQQVTSTPKKGARPPPPQLIEVGQIVEPDLLVFNNDNENLVALNESVRSRWTLSSISYHRQRFADAIRSLFSSSNLGQLWETMSRERSHKGRGQIWTLFGAFSFLMFTYLNSAFILWPYVEKLYSWPPKYYTSVTSAVLVVTLATMGIFLVVFLKTLRCSDMRLAMFGVLSLMAQCMLRGSWQHETGLYLSFIAGAIAPLSFIGVRSRLSKIIDDSERGKLFALLAIVEALIPTFASIFYSTIFAISIDVYPGLAFQIAAFLLLVPLLCIIGIDIRCKHDYDHEHVHHHHLHHQQQLPPPSVGINYNQPQPIDVAHIVT